jgi:hypothetical protein
MTVTPGRPVLPAEGAFLLMEGATLPVGGATLPVGGKAYIFCIFGILM